MGFHWKWRLADGYPAKNGLKVYSTFACGGGSTMGYKLAGFEVIGANDIDQQMAKIYQTNHHPKLYHMMDIRELTTKADLPAEMLDLDILDGSPPCSTFSMAGSREAAWGLKKQFREGQAKQTLDDLFFRFLELGERLKPKVIVAENVKGMLVGRAKNYVVAIKRKMEEMGYETQIFCLNAATMGVPQKRERVFFIGRRKDLGMPKITLEFNEKPISFGAFRSTNGIEPTTHAKKLLMLRNPQDKSIGDINKRVFDKLSGFTSMVIQDTAIFPTVTASGADFRGFDAMHCSDEDYVHAGTFPEDFDFCGQKAKYVIGMSVPPVMVAQVVNQIAKQLFNQKGQ